MEPDRPYEVIYDEERETYNVVSDTGRKILSCRDENSAGHYVALLTEAFRRGYRAASKKDRNP